MSVEMCQNSNQRTVNSLQPFILSTRAVKFILSTRAVTPPFATLDFQDPGLGKTPMQNGAKPSRGQDRACTLDSDPEYT